MLVFVWAQLGLVGWWGTTWPGLMSYDSTIYIRHVTTGPWVADHSVLYDSAVLASLTVSRSIWPLTLLQTTIFAAILAYFVASLQAIGVRGRWAAIPGFVLPAIPTFGSFVTTVWKDVPFAGASILATATILRLLARRRPDGTVERVGPLIVVLAAELTAIALFRNNGFILVVLIGAALIIVFRGSRIRMAAAMASALVIFVLAATIVYPAAHIRPASSQLAYGVFYADIAVAYGKDPTTFTTADKKLMKRVTPLHHWAESDNCYNSNPLFKKPFKPKVADVNSTRLMQLWVRVALRSPLRMLDTRLCRAEIAWDPLPSPAPVRFGGLPFKVPKGLYGRATQIPADIAANVRYQPLSATLGRMSVALRRQAVVQPWQTLESRGATWCWVAYLVLLVAAVRLRRRDVFVAGAVSLSYQLMVLAANPSQLFRYMAAPLFIGMLLVPLIIVRRSP